VSFQFSAKTDNVQANAITKSGAYLPFTTGQPVVYQTTGGGGIGLVDNRVYYAIMLPGGSLQLAADLDDAVAAPPKPVTVAWAGLGNGDSFTLTALGYAAAFDQNAIDSASHAIDVEHQSSTGDEVTLIQTSGTNTGGVAPGTYWAIRVTDDTIELASSEENALDDDPIAITAPNAPVAGGALNQYILESNVASPAFATGTTYVSGPFQFDQSALNGNDLYLPSHGFATGDAVVYRAPQDVNGNSVPLGGLTDNTVYYVIRLDANDIQLAVNVANAIAGIAIPLSFPTGTSVTGADSLTDLGPGTMFQSQANNGGGTTVTGAGPGWMFQGSSLGAGTNMIMLPNQSFQTGQMVVYRVGSGQAAATTIGGLVDDSTYFVIRVDQSTIELAASFQNAVAGTFLTLAPPGVAASWYSLTPAPAYSHISTLNGGQEYDTFSVRARRRPQGAARE
jgi:hypothetical protein